MNETKYFYGIKGIEFYFINSQSDPYLVYNGHYFNYYDIENAFWNDFKDENPNGTENEFYKFMTRNADNVRAYLDECIENGYNFTTYGDMVNAIY